MTVIEKRAYAVELGGGVGRGEDPNEAARKDRNPILSPIYIYILKTLKSSWAGPISMFTFEVFTYNHPTLKYICHFNILNFLITTLSYRIFRVSYQNFESKHALLLTIEHFYWIFLYKYASLWFSHVFLIDILKFLIKLRRNIF